MDDRDGTWASRHAGFYELPEATRLELALACLARGDRRDEAFAMLQRRYPDAPEELLRSAAFHLYWKLPEVLRDTLAQIELALRESDPELHWGVVSDALYHLYNWLQVEALLPWGKQAVWEELEELRELIKADDKDGAMGTLKRLMDQIGGSASEPRIE